MIVISGNTWYYATKATPDSNSNKYTEDHIFKMLEFLVDGIFVFSRESFFQQTVCFPVGIRLLVAIILYSNKAEFLQ